jgi:hypothetical protein
MSSEWVPQYSLGDIKHRFCLRGKCMRWILPSTGKQVRVRLLFASSCADYVERGDIHISGDWGLVIRIDASDTLDFLDMVAVWVSVLLKATPTQLRSDFCDSFLSC